VPIAVNRGNPAVLADARADFSRAVRDMAKAVSPVESAAATPKKGAAAPKGDRRWFGKAA
jgi:hypothetical protein